MPYDQVPSGALSQENMKYILDALGGKQAGSFSPGQDGQVQTAQFPWFQQQQQAPVNPGLSRRDRQIRELDAKRDRDNERSRIEAEAEAKRRMLETQTQQGDVAERNRMARDRAQADQPLASKYPWLPNALQSGAAGLAALMPNAVRRSVQAGLPQITKEIGMAQQAARAALAAGDYGGATTALAGIRAMQKQADMIRMQRPGMGAWLGEGATAAVVPPMAGMAPYGWDLVSKDTGTEANQKAMDMLYSNIPERMAVGASEGIGALLAGAAADKILQNYGGAEAAKGFTKGLEGQMRSEKRFYPDKFPKPPIKPR